MRRALAVLLPLVLGIGLGCPEDEPERSGPPRCEDCDNDPSCPAFQPSLNPLMDCDELDAQCFYCGPVMRRYQCTPDSSDELRWQDVGEADMCPPPAEPITGTG